MIHEVLYAALEGLEQGHDRQRGDDHTQPRLLLGNDEEEVVNRHVDGLKHARYHYRERAVDEGAVYDEIYIVEMVRVNKRLG
jgi:hypothetical protein